MAKYPPLDFIIKMRGDGSILDYEQLQSSMIDANKTKILEDVTLQEFLLYCLSENIVNPAYRGKLKALNLFIQKYSPNLLAESNITKKDLLEGRANLASEWRDQLIFPIMAGLWEKNKQVYKLDPDFTKALMQSDHLVLTKDMIDHLPCNMFYIDLMDCRECRPTIGIMTHIISDGCTVHASIFLLTAPENANGYLYFSDYMHAIYREDNAIELDFDKLKCADFLSFDDQLGAGKIESTIPRAALCAIPIQLIAYITSKEPEIEESLITKATYKKPKENAPISNRFNEVQMWDVGIRFGQAFRKKKKEYEAAVRQANATHGRKPPVPHYRRAHFSHYWVGKHDSPDRHLEQVWIEATMVGGKEAKDIKIHRIK